MPATKASRTSKKSGCISRFFQPKPKTSRPAEENNVIVLDDDDDDDIKDENDWNHINEKKPIRESLDRVRVTNQRRDQVKEIDDDDHEEECKPLAQKAGTEKNTALMTKTTNENRDNKIVRSKLQDPGIDNEKEEGWKSPQKSSVVVESSKENPFAKFAYGAAISAENHTGTSQRRTTVGRNWQMHSLTSGSKKRTGSHATSGSNHGDDGSRRSKKIQACSKQTEKEFVKMVDVPSEEQSRIVRKWHSMADPSAPLEVRRYQVFLAARLHARCQEPTVRKAMESLRVYFANLPEPKTIAVEEMARIEPEVLAGRISNLQFYNAKAKQIVKAAQELLERHGGMVPEDEFSLLQITGIGKVFADLLAFVNTREAHEIVCREEENCE